MLLLKKNFLRANHAPYMIKTLTKPIMQKSEIKSIFFKNQTAPDFELYKKQKNYCSKLYKKESKIYYNNINLAIDYDNGLDNLNDNRRL